jgi:hypothetical protein
MLSLRAHVLILLALLAALIAVPAAGALLQASGMQELPAPYRLPALVILFGLVAAVAFAAVPVMVMTVLGFQKAVGNEAVPAVRAATAGQKLIIWVMWALMAAGLAVAVPAAVADGFFGADAMRSATGAGPGRSEGLLVVRPGMTLEEMARRSTVKMETKSRYGGPAPVVAAGGTFDVEVADTGLTLEKARYYFVSIATDGSGVVHGVSIGTAPFKLTRAELGTADEALRRRLAAGRWLTGHEVYRTAGDRVLHGGRAEGPAGHVWLKDGVLLRLGARRMDDPIPGEPAGAGEWIQYVELAGKDGYPGIERLAFGPWHG